MRGKYRHIYRAFGRVDKFNYDPNQNPPAPIPPQLPTIPPPPPPIPPQAITTGLLSRSVSLKFFTLDFLLQFD